MAKFHECIIVALLGVVTGTMIFFLWLGNQALPPPPPWHPHQNCYSEPELCYQMGRNMAYAQILNGIVIGLYNLGFK